MDKLTLTIWISQGFLVILWIYFFFIEDKIHKINKNVDDIKVTAGFGVILYFLAIFSVMKDESHNLSHSTWDSAKVLITLACLLLIVWGGQKLEGIDVLKKLRTGSKKKDHWRYSLITFGASGILDNVAATTVAIDTLDTHAKSDKPDQDEKTDVTLLNAPSAANSGGAASPIGDSTTVYLWQKHMIDTFSILLFYVPSVVNWLIATSLTSKKVDDIHYPQRRYPITNKEKKGFFILIGVLLFVPILKIALNLEVWQAALIALIGMFLIVRKVPNGAHLYEEIKPALMMALIVFMMSQLSYSGLLQYIGLSMSLWHVLLIILVLGALSVLVDNMAVVAMAVHAMGTVFPAGHFFWYGLAYSAGTSGSIHLPGSSAGVTLKKRIEKRFTNLTITYFFAVGWINLLAWLGGMLVLSAMYFYFQPFMTGIGINF
jgi:Na+/H+ antiporter NhaD/arsenite permease-like protein